MLLTFLTNSHFAFAAERNTPEVVVTKAQIAELQDELTYPGRVLSQVNAAIQAPNDGIVREILVGLGTKVKKNQPLIRIRKNEPGLSFAPLTVRAPVDGVVSDLKISLGSEVVRGQQIADITDPQKLKIIINVAAQDLPYLKPGAAGEFISEAGEPSAEKKPMKIILSAISPMTDSLTGTATVEIALAANTGLLMGSLGLVKLGVNHHRGIQIMEGALRYKGAETFVSIIEKGIAKNRPVSVSSRARGMAEISKGLNDGESVVIRSSSFVGDGVNVTVSTAKQ